MFSLDFETDNAAFGPDEADARSEVWRILRQVAQKVLEGGEGEGAIMDANANKVGSWGLAWEQEE